MDLYIIRHADAGDRKQWKGDDDDRPLSALGHDQARALGEWFRRRGIAVGAIVTSPLLRATQTAADFRTTANPDGAAPVTCDLLAPGELRRKKLSKFLAGIGAKSVAVVGHDPDLPAYLGWLLDTDSDQIYLEKGGAALVRFDDRPGKDDGTLIWLVTPDWYMPAN